MMMHHALLHIVSDQALAEKLHAMGLPGQYLAWSDLLIEGPVDGQASRPEWCRERSSYFSGRHVADYKTLMQGYQRRFDVISQLDRCDELVLWFDASAVSQLRFYQVLSSLDEGTLATLEVNLPDETMLGKSLSLREQAEESLLAAYEQRREVTQSQLTLANQFWHRFSQSEPREWVALLKHDMTALPHAKTTLRRVMELLPSSENGLSRLQTDVLREIGNKGCPARVLLENKQLGREYVEMSALTLYLVLMPLYFAKAPLIDVQGSFFSRCSGQAAEESILRLTAVGENVLWGREDFIEINGIDRWLGSVHLSPENIWRHNAIRSVIMHTVR